MDKRLSKQFESVLQFNQIARDSPPSVKEQEDYTKEELREYTEAVKDKNLIEELDAIADIFVTGSYLDILEEENGLALTATIIIDIAIQQHGFPLIEAVINEVCKSNMSKFVDVDEVEEVDWYIAMSVEHIHKHTNYKGVHGEVRMVNKDLNVIVFKDSNNKIMKPSTYFKPNIKGVLEGMQ